MGKPLIFLINGLALFPLFSCLADSISANNTSNNSAGLYHRSVKPAPLPNRNPRSIGLINSQGSPPILPMGKLPKGGFQNPLRPPPSPSSTHSNPFPNSWNDRRPIGSLFLSRQYDVINPKNPAGWEFNGTLPTDWDYTTTKKISAIQKGLLDLANSCVAKLKAMNAQGVIVWDANGSEFGGLQYFGEPNAIPWMVPEFDQVSDQFFNIFKAAGLRIGVCIRADKAIFTAPFSHSQLPYRNLGEAIADMDAKISYAHDRWGCTLFYVDSNGGGFFGANHPGQVYPASLFSALHERHPDSLIIPEFFYTSLESGSSSDTYLTSTAPYNQTRPPDFVFGENPDLLTTPRAFIVLDISDISNYVDIDTIDLSFHTGKTYREELIDGVKSGRIVLMTRAWFDSNEEHELIRSIYSAAGY